jgi:hypothetical protein
MSAGIRHSFIGLWIAALLIATVGVSVQQIYCYCVGKTTIAFFRADDACRLENTSDTPGCCERQSPPSIGTSASCCQKETGAGWAETDGCMEKSTKVFQLKTEFLVDKPSDKTLDCPAWLGEMPIFKRFFRPAICEAAHFNKPPPVPPLSGRAICVRHHLFRC